MNIEEAKRVVEIVAELATGIRLDFIKKREDCRVFLFMSASDDDQTSGIDFSMSWKENGHRTGVSRGGYASPELAINELSKIGIHLGLGDFQLLLPPLTYLECAWRYANSSEYHEAVDLTMREVVVRERDY